MRRHLSLDRNHNVLAAHSPLPTFGLADLAGLSQWKSFACRLRGVAPTSAFQNTERRANRVMSRNNARLHSGSSRAISCATAVPRKVHARYDTNTGLRRLELRYVAMRRGVTHQPRRSVRANYPLRSCESVSWYGKLQRSAVAPATNFVNKAPHLKRSAMRKITQHRH